MGYYIQGLRPKEKVLQLNSIVGVNNVCHVSRSVARKLVEQYKDRDYIGVNEIGVVCVVDNGDFETAAYIYDLGEFDAFNVEGDLRRRVFLAMPRIVAAILSGFLNRETEYGLCPMADRVRTRFPGIYETSVTAFDHRTYNRPTPEDYEWGKRDESLDELTHIRRNQIDRPETPTGETPNNPDQDPPRLPQ